MADEETLTAIEEITKILHRAYKGGNNGFILLSVNRDEPTQLNVMTDLPRHHVREALKAALKM